MSRHGLRCCAIDGFPLTGRNQDRMKNNPQPSQEYVVLIHVLDAQTGEPMQRSPSWLPLDSAFVRLVGRFPKQLAIEVESVDDESCAVFFIPPPQST